MLKLITLVTSALTIGFIFLAQSAGAYSSGGSMGSGLMLKPSLMYLYDSQSGTNGNGVTTTRTLIDAGLGYRFATSPFYLGGVYTYDNTADTGTSSAKDLTTAYGAAIGLITDNVYMLFNYYVSAQYDQTSSSGTTTSYTSGSGFGVAIGYMFSVGSSFRLGPELDYRNLQYTKRSVSGSSGSASLTMSTLVPYVTMMISL
jgi:hypothetical protein